MTAELSDTVERDDSMDDEYCHAHEVYAHFGLVLGVTGAAILASPWDTDQAVARGVIACLVAAISYGLQCVYQARFLTSREYSPLILACAQTCAATAFLAVTLPSMTVLSGNQISDHTGRGRTWSLRWGPSKRSMGDQLT